MVYHIFKRNTLERNGSCMIEHWCLSERRCPKEKNLRRTTVKTASPLSWTVSSTKTIYRNMLDSEADFRLQVSPIILKFKTDVFMKTASSIILRNEHIIILCFYWLINLQWGYCSIFSYKKKNESLQSLLLLLLLCVYCQHKFGVVFREIFQFGKGFHKPKSLNNTALDLHVKWLLKLSKLSSLDKTRNRHIIFIKFYDIKFRENVFCVSLVVACTQSYWCTDGQAIFMCLTWI